MKLTKTQARLLDEASKRGGIYSVETASGRGPHGGEITYGNRDIAALHRLVSAGLVRIIHREASREFTGNGYSVHGSVITFERIAK